MRIAYFDGAGGIAGHLILGALVDLGLPLERLRTLLAAFAPAAFQLASEPVQYPAGAATIVTLKVVQVAVPSVLLDTAAGLPPTVAERTVAALRRLFDVTAAATGVASDALDPVQSTRAAGLIAGVIGGLAMLGVERVQATAINIGGSSDGSRRATEPSEDFGEGAGFQPSTVALTLLRDAVVAVGPVPAFVTPVGAAIARELVSSYDTLPPIRLVGVGVGAGRGGDAVVNRVLLGESGSAAVDVSADWVTVVECNLDDQNPQVFEHVTGLLFGAGALDVYVTPILMKKGRPATMLTVIGRPEQAESLASIVLRETTTLGVRFQEMPRRILRRTFEKVETLYGPITVKIAWAAGAPLKAAPEYEDCRRAAVEHGAPLQRVMDAARAAWLKRSALE